MGGGLLQVEGGENIFAWVGFFDYLILFVPLRGLFLVKLLLIKTKCGFPIKGIRFFYSLV